ncbi:serine/threonine-protein phosphatase 2A 55 kDa regulatory subunit B beta isoform isoform X1 [Aphis craccivora]|uniref:Serine/threonine-protein phosphatase 2A 55 kDa regulatory subunit B beta isoform isoform X1 n=1 Tax=Aphis craccivora TaxID=307492 RepID=A0A6G0ZQ77_APHCR|nr:serine/threonine-protein phosphatase 2A 55 kDa regulatory subunit B beta isoform isoform X1 [Aphis craccivora]
MRHTEVVGLWRPTDPPPGGKTRVSRATDQGASHTSHAHKFVIKSTAMIRQSSLTRFIVNKKNNTVKTINCFKLWPIMSLLMKCSEKNIHSLSVKKKKNNLWSLTLALIFCMVIYIILVCLVMTIRIIRKQDIVTSRVELPSNTYRFEACFKFQTLIIPTMGALLLCDNLTKSQLRFHL